MDMKLKGIEFFEEESLGIGDLMCILRECAVDDVFEIKPGPRSLTAGSEAPV